MTTEELIKNVIEEVKELLLEKNRNYGDAAINPSNVFSNGDPLESLGARIDDKLMRIKNVGINNDTEDTLMDLIGYLILYKVAMIKEVQDEYDSEKEIIGMGGFIVNSGKTIATMDQLNLKYSEKKCKK